MTEPRSLLTPQFDRALSYAFELHGGDTRKGTDVPYMAHLLGVCALVLADGGDEDEAIAALLHDSLEDKGEIVTPAGLEKGFGERVRALVVACTDTEPGYKGGVKREWLPRKEDYLAHIRAAQRVNRVALADKLDNARAILADYRMVGEPLWDRFTTKSRDDQLWFYRSSVEAFRAAGAEGFLIDELERTVAEIERLAATA